MWPVMKDSKSFALTLKCMFSSLLWCQKSLIGFANNSGQHEKADGLDLRCSQSSSRWFSRADQDNSSVLLLNIMHNGSIQVHVTANAGIYCTYSKSLSHT